MNKILQRLFLFEKYDMTTRLSKKEILKKIDSFADPEYTDYYGSISENGFFIAEKTESIMQGDTVKILLRLSLMPVSRRATV